MSVNMVMLLEHQSGGETSQTDHIKKQRYRHSAIY